MACKIVCLTLLLIAAVSARNLEQPETPDTRIVGGVPTTIEQFPYIVSFVYFYPGPGMYIQRCVGSLVSSWHVLTAAFCFAGADLNLMLIRAGSTNSLSGGTVTTINSFVNHPDYTQAPRFADIAVTTLNFPLALSESIQVLFLPPQNWFIADGTSVKIVSWGFESETGPQLETLSTIDLNKLPLDVCKEIYEDSTNVIIDDPVICASQTGQIGMCLGDSGAPMVLATNAGNVVVGLASYYQGCGDNYWPDVFTRIDRYTSWIMEVAVAPSSTHNATLMAAPRIRV